jgi:hypothetical protein
MRVDDAVSNICEAHLPGFDRPLEGDGPAVRLAGNKCLALGHTGGSEAGQQGREGGVPASQLSSVAPEPPHPGV